MSKRVLVAGVNGFVGHHLARELVNTGHTVIGVGIDARLSPELSDTVAEFYSGCDLTNANQVAELPLETVDVIINLAGLASVGDSFKVGAAERYQHTNVAVHTTVAQRLRELSKPKTRIIAVSTGAVYDNTQSMPINEDGALIQQGSPYALSKIAMEDALNSLRQKGQDIIVVRPFNHIGPGQLPGFLVPDLAEQLQKSATIRVGNLDTERDYTDVRDVVRAYVLLATQPKLKHFVYNVCSGQSISGRTMLSLLAKSMNKYDYKIVIDDSKIRPNDPLKVVGDNSRIAKETDWQPTIKLEKTIEDFVHKTAVR